MDGTPTEELVTSARAGDADAFGQLVHRYQDVVFASAYAMLGDRHLAQDVAQEAFLQAYRDLSSLRDAAAFPGWLRRIVLKYADRVRRSRRNLTVAIDAAFRIADPGPDPSSIAVQRELQATVQAEVARLSERDRLLVALYYGAGHAQDAIAAFFEVPPTTIKKRLHDTRRRLKERLMPTFAADLANDRPSRDDRFTRKVRFLIAVRTGNVREVERELRADPSLVHASLAREEWGQPELGQSTMPMQWGFTPLHFAAKFDMPEIARALIAHGAPLDDDTRGETPLLVATRANHPRLVQLLLEAGADPTRAARTGVTPLRVAEMRGNVETARLLASRGARGGPILETGIKVVDVFAPIRLGGTVLMHAGFGVGKLVLLGEFTHRVARRGGHSVLVSWRQRYYRPDDAMHEMREMGVADVCTFLLGDLADPLPTLKRGLDAAAQLRSEGRDVLLFVDQTTGQPLPLEPVAPTVDGSLTIVFYDLEPTNGAPEPGNFDTVISFSVDLAHAGIYPAVDPLASSSSLLGSGELGSEHVRIAQSVRDAIHAGGERGRRLQLFQSQPFFVAEPWTAKPGVFVPLRESLASYAALLEGAFDDASDQQLLYAGAIVKPGS